MGKFIKKLTAILLVVATLASFVVPATFADGGTGAAINYDFQLVTNSQVTVNEQDKYSKVSGTIKSAYDNGTHNWRLETTASTVSNSSDMRFYGTNDNEGLRLMNLVAGEWVAFRIKVAQAGNYEVALTGGNVKYNPYQATMYTFAAPAGAVAAADIEAAMVNANLIGAVSVAEGSEKGIAGEHTFAAGDNILIIALNPSGSRASIQDIDLTPKAASIETTSPSDGTTAPAIEPVNLDFELYNNPAFSTAIPGDGNKLGHSKVSGAINSAYDNGTHNWKLETVAEGVDTTVHTKFFSKSDEGLRLTIGAGKWIALRVKVAEAGNYEVSIKNNIPTNGYKATVYALAAPAGTMTAADVEAAMTSANLVGTADHTTKNNVAVAGEKEFAEGENILIIEIDTARAGIADIDLTPKAASNVPTDPSEDTTAPAKEEKIDFELYYNDAFSSEIKGGYEKYSNTKNLIANAYAAGTLNWKFEAVESGLEPKFVINNGANQGIRTDSVNGKYVAIRFKVSEAAKYDVTYNSVYGYNFGAKTWIVSAPTADTVDIAAAKVDANKMGNVAITTSVLSCDLGSYDFAAGEYVLIFEGTGERLYMGNIVLTEAQDNQEETTAPSEDTTAPEETTQPSFTFQDNVFDFELYNYSNFSNKINGVSNKYSSVKSTVENAYPAVNNWVIEACSAGTSFASLQFNATQRGFRMNVEADNWVAIRLNVTKAGKYEVVLNCLYNAGYPYDAKAWLFPAAAQTMTVAEVEAAMVSANAMADVSIAKDRDKSILGEYEFAVGEYILVMKAAAARMYITTLELAELGSVEKPPEDTRPEYVAQPGYFEFELYNYKGTGVAAEGYTKYSKVLTSIAQAIPASLTGSWKAFPPS